jgi:hypothetical protein
MAERILMKHPVSGLIAKGFYGFSWTTSFFGGIPALFRGDFVTFLLIFAVQAVLGVFTLGIGSVVFGLIWAFFYNRYYTRKLVEKGYVFADSETRNQEALQAVGVVPVAAS